MSYLLFLLIFPNFLDRLMNVQVVHDRMLIKPKKYLYEIKINGFILTDM